ncbi:hypothetical protein [Pyxidicoccus sp. MSG2]|uniref:hypothetical protein n=1 Tax=Pyxidicoccus sp. MSG2 TaxID=2996790 RepID=UPI00226F42C0|nr:hypothetical protein [Pyxidicoccus sp. MSG2]MCY1019667.1 hypothetical protein [Pyxidicoccus sp. MSG2]
MMDHAVSTFLSGCAPFHDLCFFAKALDELMETGVTNSTFFCLDAGELTKSRTSVGWTAVAAATIKPQGQMRALLYIGGRGDFWEVNTQTVEETTGRIEGVRFSLTSLAAIDDVIFACGMGREVFRREDTGRWTSMSPKEPLPDTGIVGFEALAGFSLDEIYAVGWEGELWLLRGNQWRRLESPVSTHLSAVCCAADGKVYVTGDDGVLLRGRLDTWEVLETGRRENLRDVQAFDGTVCVATDFRILKLDGHRLVPETAFVDDDRPSTCVRLLRAEDGLFSMGLKDLFLFRGGSWKRLV